MFFACNRPLYLLPHVSRLRLMCEPASNSVCGRSYKRFPVCTPSPPHLLLSCHFGFLFCSPFHTVLCLVPAFSLAPSIYPHPLRYRLLPICVSYSITFCVRGLNLPYFVIRLYPILCFSASFLPRHFSPLSVRFVPTFSAFPYLLCCGVSVSPLRVFGTFESVEKNNFSSIPFGVPLVVVSWRSTVRQLVSSERSSVCVGV